LALVKAALSSADPVGTRQRTPVTPRLEINVEDRAGWLLGDLEQPYISVLKGRKTVLFIFHN
jgi:hypothetical protein